MAQWVDWAERAMMEGELARSGLIWQLLAANPNLERALARLQLNTPLLLEAEEGTGAGQIMTRSLASDLKTVWLHDGESRTLTAQIPAAARYQLGALFELSDYLACLMVIESRN